MTSLPATSRRRRSRGSVWRRHRRRSARRRRRRVSPSDRVCTCPVADSIYTHHRLTVTSCRSSSNALLNCKLQTEIEWKRESRSGKGEDCPHPLQKLQNDGMNPPMIAVPEWKLLAANCIRNRVIDNGGRWRHRAGTAGQVVLRYLDRRTSTIVWPNRPIWGIPCTCSK